MTTIDLNSDVGESFGNWRMGDDAAIFRSVSSANVACGFHAGDPSTIAQTCRDAVAAGITIGAHVGYRDLAGFGRRFVDCSATELVDDVLYQMGALQAMARSAGGEIRYVKPHGALYHAMVDHEVHAQAVIDAVKAFGGDLPLPEVDDEDLVRSHFFSLLESSFLLFAHLFFCLLGQDEDAGEAAAAAQPTTSAASRKTSKKAEAHASGGSAGAGMFGWCDGPLLRALKEGHWVLLDELNLAPQSVLEGTGVFFCLPLHFTRIMLTI